MFLEPEGERAGDLKDGDMVVMTAAWWHFDV